MVPQSRLILELAYLASRNRALSFWAFALKDLVPMVLPVSSEEVILKLTFILELLFAEVAALSKIVVLPTSFTMVSQIDFLLFFSFKISLLHHTELTVSLSDTNKLTN